MFDIVIIPCPECGEPYEQMCKNGPCNFENYFLETAPDSILLEVQSYSPFTCKECGAIFAVDLSSSSSGEYIM